MNKAVKFCILLTLLLTIASCSTTYTSTLFGDSYDKIKDTTTLTVIPYGNVSLPGKWTKSSYDDNSRQHYFVNKDSTTVAIVFGPCEKYEFYKSEMNKFESVNKFYEWDSSYLSETYNLNRTILKTDSVNCYLVWNMSGNGINNYFLSGRKGDFFFNIMIYSYKINEKIKLELLEHIFLNGCG